MKSENRLRKNKQFEYVYKKGERFYSKNISLFFTKSKFQTVKVGFSVSKKIGKSVVRSKIKRRMKECVRLLISNIKSHHNLVFVARTGIENLNYEQIKKEICFLLEKAELINVF